MLYAVQATGDLCIWLKSFESLKTKAVVTQETIYRANIVTGMTGQLLPNLDAQYYNPGKVFKSSVMNQNF